MKVTETTTIEFSKEDVEKALKEYAQKQGFIIEDFDFKLATGHYQSHHFYDSETYKYFDKVVCKARKNTTIIKQGDVPYGN